MSEMVERVARVICETQNVDGFKCTCPLRGEPKGNDWCNGNRAIAQARAAIAAMREPTEQMLGITDADEFDTDIYRRMIDAALRADEPAPTIEDMSGVTDLMRGVSKP